MTCWLRGALKRRSSGPDLLSTAASALTGDLSCDFLLHQYAILLILTVNFQSKDSN